MKNLLIYTGPNKKFSPEDSKLAKIQIDNSFSLGWKKEDIIVATDFPFEYNRIKGLALPDNLYYDFDTNANKAIVTLYLINQGLIEPQTLYWCHDFDAYENEKINESELDLDNYDLGLTHYYYKPQWQFGSFFFKTTSKDILTLLNDTIKAKPHPSRNNEKTLTKLIDTGKIDSKRFKKLNVTYNFTKRYIETVYKEAKKPLRVLHFRPSDKDALMPDTALRMFMYGKNSLKIPLMSERLIKIFKYHGTK